MAYATFAAALPILLLVPGWAWLRRVGVDPLVSVYAGLGLTVLVAAAVVAVAVLLPWAVPATCTAALVVMLGVSVWCVRTAPRPLLPTPADLAGVAAFVVAFFALAAYSGVPSRPYGFWPNTTLGPGHVESPRWPGMPDDNTLPYRTGQVALHKLGGRQIRDRYSNGWWLSDRTPLTGLAFAFLAGATHVQVPTTDPITLPRDRAPMTTHDRFGFWAYQLTAIALNAAIVLGIFLLARVWLGSRQAIVAALLGGLAPGLFLNGIYTWPKQAIAYFVLAGAACALRRMPILAGALGALGYLTHPAGLFWLPSIGLLLLAGARPRAGRRLLGRYAASAAVLVAPWSMFTALVMHATSRWATAPLGYLMRDPTRPGHELSIAWHAFVERGVAGNVWVRIQSTAGSVFPLDLGAPPSGLASGLRRGTGYLWVQAHGFSVWGMLGIVLFPFALAALVRGWMQLRSVVLRMGVPAVILVELGNGLPYPFANQSMFPLVGLLAVVAARGLVVATPRTGRIVVAVVAAELVSVAYGVLLVPYNIGLVSGVGLTATTVVGQLALVGALIVTVDDRAEKAAWKVQRRLRRRFAGLVVPGPPSRAPG